MDIKFERIVLVIGITLGALYLVGSQKSKNRARFIENTDHSEERNPSWDPVDQASWESFPASDPPAMW